LGKLGNEPVLQGGAMNILAALKRICGDWGSYLGERFGWPGDQWCGWLEHKRWHQGKEETSPHVWIVEAAFPWFLTAKKLFSGCASIG